MSTNSIPNYNCSQSTLYNTARVMWENCRKYITVFSTFKPFYTDAYIDARLAEITTAEKMKNLAARALEHKQLREDMVVLASICLDEWTALKLYIMSAFTEDYIEMNWEAAGWQSYADAANENWPKMNELMNAGSDYIADNLAKLSANNNMPNSFPLAFNTAKEAFALKYSEFAQAEENAEVGTSDKIMANNDVYAKVIAMGQDGQYVKRDNESTKKQFSFEAVSELLQPSGASSIVLTIENSTDEMPLPNATVEVIGTDKTATSDSNGRVSINQLAAGSIQLKVTADGFTEQIINMTLKTGTTSRQTIEMQPLFTGEMKVGPEKEVSSPELVVNN